MDKKEPELRSTKMLRDAIQDTELLLLYASEQGLVIDPKYIKAIVSAKRDEQNNSWTEQEEVEFWSAFQVISKIVLPVSIDSLRAAATPVEKPKNWWQKVTFQKDLSLVARSVGWYRKLALFFMIIMLSLQIYGIIGTALMANYSANNNRMLEIEKRMNEIVSIISNNSEDQTAAAEQRNLETEHTTLTEEVQSTIELMDSWLNFTPNLWSRNIDDNVSSVMEMKAASDSIPLPPTQVSASTSKNVVVVQQTNSLIIILNQYVLPLLYGLLGGFAFVLRSLADETRRMVYTPASNIKFGLRIQLGALAGLVIGFLWGDFQGKSFGFVESLSPLAVAFLAGYSVDFLFRMLDSVVGNIAKREANVAEAVVSEPAKNKQ